MGIYIKSVCREGVLKGKGTGALRGLMTGGLIVERVGQMVLMGGVERVFRGY